MIEINKDISIRTPARKISEFLIEPSNYPEIWSSMLECQGMERAADGSHYLKTRFVYKMAGVRVEGISDTLEFIPERSLVTKSSGGIDNTIRWTLEPNDSGTHVRVNMQYQVPIPVLGKLAEQVVARMNEREVQTMLENLKTRMESDA